MAKQVLITGCSRGIGRATAELLSARGHRVIATARVVDDLADLDVADTLPLDVTDPASVRSAAERAGPVDVLVNNAGRGYVGPVEMAGLPELRQLWESNVLGPLSVMQAFLPSMREQGSGRVVNVSSVSGRRAMPLTGNYAATKQALEALSESLRFEVAQFGIDVVMVEPAGVTTEFASRRLDEGSPVGPYGAFIDRARRMARRVNPPAQTAAEVAEVIASVIEAEHPPFRVPTGEGAAAGIALRTSRTDEEFMEWVQAELELSD
jgi:NAD(P)-dependent dehydrogenase (short-subunit alcohol dehydrogenase family)